MNSTKKKKARVVRNSLERFRQLKNRILMKEIRELLPSQPTMSKKRAMTQKEVLEKASRYIQILQETLQENERHREDLLTWMVLTDGTQTDSDELQRELVEQEQNILDAKIDKLMSSYGNSSPRVEPNLYNLDDKLADIMVDVAERDNYGGQRGKMIDSLGLSSNPLIFVNSGVTPSDT